MRWNAYSDADNGWEYNSYIELTVSFDGIEVVRMIGSTRPIEEGESSNPGGGGGGSATPPLGSDLGIEFDDDDLEDFNNEWQECTERIQPIEGYLEYEVITDYPWETSMDDVPGMWGETKHDPKNVIINPGNINANLWGITFEHFITQTVLNEYVQTIQGPPNILEDNMFDREVEAFNLSYHWYRAIFRKSPPLTPLTQQQIDDAKSASGYFAAVDAIDDLLESVDTNGLSIEEYQDLLDLQHSLYNYLPQQNYDENYDQGALDCSEED